MLTFSARTLNAENVKRVSNIFALRDDLKVFDAVVGDQAVLMVDYHIRRD